MKSKMNRSITILVMICMLVSLLAIPALAAEGGNCGKDGGNVKWSLDDEGLLHIYGSGEMKSYSDAAPWRAFCHQIKAVQIDEGVTSLTNGIFDQCDNLKRVDIPASVKSITCFPFGSYEFVGSERVVTSGIEYISVAEGNKNYMSLDGVVYTKDGKTLLYYPPARKSDYVIPEGVTEIAHNAFLASAITGVTMPSTLKTVPNAAFMFCSDLKKATIPVGVERIMWAAFRECTNLESVTFPEGLETIEELMFHYCLSLKSVAIPVSVKKIESGAFNSGSLKDVYYAGTKEQWDQIKVETGNRDLESATKHYLTGMPDGLSNFKKVNTYPSGKFTDVPVGDWYAESVKNAYELDLVKGESESKFSPAGSVNIAAAITLACRIHSIYHNGEANFVQGNPWYQVYVDYAVDNGLIKAGEYTDMGAKATRVQYAAIMSKALPDSALESINTVDDNAIPDVKMTDPHAADIYRLYRAGILTGSDTRGTFNPQSDIKRAEVAALVTRMADPSLRRSVTLTVEPEAPEREIPYKENYHGHVYTGGANSTKYHYEAECAGKNSHEITWEEVDARGLQPCGTCVLK